MHVPSGKLYIIDPFTQGEEFNGILVAPGSYRVVATACDVVGPGEPPNPRIAFMTVILDDQFSASDALEAATPGFNLDATYTVEDTWHLFCFDANAAFADADAFDHYDANPEDSGIDDEDWMRALDNTAHLIADVANCPLTSDGTHNVVITHTGDGSGEFPLFYTRNEAGTITSFTVDYQMHCYSDYTDDIDDEQPGWQIEAFQPLYDQAMQLPLLHPAV